MKKNIVGKIYKRPWGTYQTLKIKENCQIKWIEVLPKGKLSLQKHLKRSEHWVIVQGKAKITLNDEVKIYKKNDHVFIDKKMIHRIENNTNKKVILVEVQLGSYLSEDDIIRLEDIYGRN